MPPLTTLAHSVLLAEILPPEVPVVQIPSAGAQVRGEAQPAQVRQHAPGGGPVDGPPEPGQIGVQAQEGDEVDGGLDGAPEAEEEGHPHEVEAELDRVQRRRVLGVPDELGRRGQGAEAGRDGPVGGVAHQGVEQRPRRAEDVGGRAEGRLFDRWVGVDLWCLFC